MRAILDARRELRAVAATLLVVAGMAGWIRGSEGEDAGPAAVNPRDLGEQLQEACTAQLREIGVAVAAYREAEGELPYWLSDLVEAGFLADDSLAVCPVTRRTGALPDVGLYFPDPRIRGSYLYEFSPSEFDSWAGRTMRAWKLAQVEAAGDRVPLVRCTLHGHVLNLSVGGEIYESELDWEKDVEDPAVQTKLRATWNGRTPDSPEQSPSLESLVGTPLPDLRFELLGGGLFETAEARGRGPLVLYLWGTWCGSCTRVFPWLEELEEEFADRGLTLMTVNGSDPPRTIREALEIRESTLPVALDPEQTFRREVTRAGYPFVLVVDGEGVITWAFDGMSSNFRDRLREEVLAALK